jgi:hypothetical protein
MLDSAVGTPEFERWLDTFFDSYYKHRPVNATFIGVHDYDRCLPDYSESGLADTLADMQSMLQRLGQLPAEPLTRAQEIDRRLCEGYLRIQCWEYEQDHVIRANPGLYIGEAIFGVLALFLTDFAPRSDRVAAATERLHAIPDLLRQGRENIKQAPAEWLTHAIAECGGALAFLDNGALLAAGQEVTSKYRQGVERATQGFREFASFLDEKLKGASVDPLTTLCDMPKRKRPQHRNILTNTVLTSTRRIVTRYWRACPRSTRRSIGITIVTRKLGTTCVASRTRKNSSPGPTFRFAMCHNPFGQGLRQRTFISCITGRRPPSAGRRYTNTSSHRSRKPCRQISGNGCSVQTMTVPSS